MKIIIYKNKKMHIWIIMDWNRRWAKERLLPAVSWHKAWADNIKNIVEIAWKKEISYLTLWALSVDNLEKRDEKEVKNIIKLIDNIEYFLWEMLEKDLKFQVIWNLSKLPEKSQNILQNIIEKTKNNVWLILNIGLVYGWQDEIIRATRKIIEAGIKPEDLTKEEFKKYLDTANLPNPDLIIRTGWDTRHSGFLLFDSEYSEYYFTEKKWPEFDEKEFDKALNSLKNSKRNFWK